MDSFGKSRKFSSCRKQEVLLQNELKAIRNKALLDHYAKQRTGIVSQSATCIPKPPSEPFPGVLSRKRLKQGQTADIKSVSNTVFCEPTTAAKSMNKKQCKSSALQPMQNASPQKLVVAKTTSVKFGITSSMKTSVPVRQVLRQGPKTVAQKSLPVMKRHSSIKKPSFPLLTDLQENVTSTSVEKSVISTTFTIPSHTVPTTAPSQSDLEQRVEHSSSASSVGLSLSHGSPEHSQVDLDSHAFEIPEGTFAVGSETRMPYAPAAMLTLKVNMPFTLDMSEDQLSGLSHSPPLSDHSSSSEGLSKSSNDSRVASSVLESHHTHEVSNYLLDSPPPSISSSACVHDHKQGSQSSLDLSPKNIKGDSETYFEPVAESTDCFHPTADGSSHTKSSSSTIKASVGKESLVFSVDGSLSSFGQPFSAQQYSSPSLTDTSSRVLSSSMEEEYSNTSDQSSVKGYFLPQLASDQKLATSSWLQALDNNNSGDSTLGMDKEESLESHVSDSLPLMDDLKLSLNEVEENVEKRDSVHKPVDSCISIEPASYSIEELATLTTDDAKSVGPKNDCIVSHHTTEISVDCEQLEQDNAGNHAAPSQDSLHEFLAFSNSPVTLEDVLNITGTKFPDNLNGALPSVKTSDSNQSKLLFLSTWNNSVSRPGYTHASVHHFCTETQLPQLPLPIRILSRQSHTKGLIGQDKHTTIKQELFAQSPPKAHKPSTISKVTLQKYPSCSEHSKQYAPSNFNPTKYPSKSTITTAQEGLLREINYKCSKKTSSRVKQLPSRFVNDHDSNGLVVSGNTVQIAQDPLNLLWVPAPPKLSLHPSTIQFHLFPQYKTRPMTVAGAVCTLSATMDQSECGVEASADQDNSTVLKKPRFLGTTHSVPNFATLRAELVSHPNDKEDTKSIQFVDKAAVSSNHNEQEDLTKESHTIDSPSRSNPISHLVDSVMPHTQSLPQLTPANVRVESRVGTATEEFNALMKEIGVQRESLIQHHKDQMAPKPEATISTDDFNLLEETQTFEESTLATSGTFISRKLQRQFMRGTKRSTSKKGTIGRVRAIRRTKSAQLRAEKAREFLSQPPKNLKRRASFPLIHKELTEHPPASSKSYPLACRSLPDLTDDRFDSLMRSQGAKPGSDDPYKWAYSVWWDRWFPEVLKECREAVAELYTGGGACTTTTSHKPKPKVQTKQRELTYHDEIPEVQEIDYSNVVLELEDIPAVFDEPLVSESIEREVFRLSKTIEWCQDKAMVAVYYCRRGGLLRKLGKLKESLVDLNHALSLQPTLSDAYWHRHLLFLVQGDNKSALEDLFLLLKQNKRHFGAYRSRAMLLLRKGDLSSAVYNMSQAIALRPKDPGSYFARAEIYEKRGEVESALSDYAFVSELDLTNTEALSRSAMHKFNKGMWGASTQYFSTLLKRDPNNTVARIHRAKAHYNMGQYIAALQDLSAAIHLEPNGAQAFYHRGTLLRNSQPKQALKDFSVSLLLDDTIANVAAFIHRGVLYTQLNCFDEALADFESAVRLNRTLPSPHVCAGLVYMLHKSNVTRAIRCFSAAIFVDPVCLRAYLCRADAYQRDAKFKLAILDYTRAIHMDPNNPSYYLYKGELYLRLGELELASFHISIAAKLRTGFDQNKAQRALVDCFLGRYDQAIMLLRGLPKTSEIYSLLGKIQFKAGDFNGSAESLKQAVYLAETTLKPSHLVTQFASRGDIEKSVARKTVDFSAMNNFHFACGRSLAENGSLKEAVVEFSNVLQVAPNHAQAYYERGVAKLMDENPKGMLDLNKSLALSPKLTQSYLARAAYYGKIGRYSKAILNCNEAIRLEPASVRAYVCRGALKYLSQMHCSAIEDFSTAIRLDPQHASLAHFNRALCYHALGKTQMALSEYSILFLMTDSPLYQVMVNRALLYLEMGDWANGLLDFIMAGKAVKSSPAIFQAIGYCYHRLGSLDSAIEAYTEAISLDPTFFGAYIGRGNAYMDYCSEEGNEKSRLDYVHTLELNPGNLLARINMAFLLQAEGKFQEAWNELTRVLQADQWCVPAREARAIISLQMNNLFGALLDINAAIQVCKSALLLTNRGVIYQFMGDIVSAMNDYHEAVQIEPKYSLAHFNMGNILFQQRHFKQAVVSYTKAMGEKDNNDFVFLNRAIAFVMLRDTQSAIDDFSKAIQVNPFSAHAHFNRGNLYHSLGEFEKAEQDYKQALELQPEDWLTMFYYGETMGKLNRDRSAHCMFTKAAATEQS